MPRYFFPFPTVAHSDLNIYATRRYEIQSEFGWAFLSLFYLPKPQSQEHGFLDIKCIFERSRIYSCQITLCSEISLPTVRAMFCFQIALSRILFCKFDSTLPIDKWAQTARRRSGWRKVTKCNQENIPGEYALSHPLFIDQENENNILLVKKRGRVNMQIFRE